MCPGHSSLLCAGQTLQSLSRQSALLSITSRSSTSTCWKSPRPEEERESSAALTGNGLLAPEVHAVPELGKPRESVVKSWLDRAGKNHRERAERQSSQDSDDDASSNAWDTYELDSTPFDKKVEFLQILLSHGKGKANYNDYSDYKFDEEVEIDEQVEKQCRRVLFSSHSPPQPAVVEKAIECLIDLTDVAFGTRELT